MSSCASPISADRHSSAAGKSPISAGRPVSAGRPTGSAGRPVSAGRPIGSAGRPTGSAGRPVFTGNPTGSAGRPVYIFDCPKSGIFTSSSYNEEFSGPDANNLASSVDKSSQTQGSSDSAFISYIYDQRRNNHPDFQLCMFSCFLSQEEPTTVAQALADPDWVEAMQEKCNNSGIKRGIVCRNKARLVAQGHRQEEGIDYTDVFAPVARIEAIRLFLAFASFIGFMVYQMDVKSAFLYGKISKEVYVTQPRGFEDPNHPKKVCKVVKALSGLHQAPKAWYERLFTFLLKHGYRRGTIDKTLFIKKDSKDIMLVQVYVDDIIFGSTRKDWCEEYETLM
nr:putative ribonuclease H-like domain-containing protein [Tanacetum cinerariifolium]